MGRADRRIMLKQAMAEVSRAGMDLRAPSGDQSWQVIAATRILIDVLKGHSPLRASKAAEKATSSSRPRIKRNATGVKIECAKGCAYCCYVRGVRACAGSVSDRQHDPRAADFDARSIRIHDVERATHRLGRIRARAAEASLRAARETMPAPSMRAPRTLPVASPRRPVRHCHAAFNGAAVSIPTPMVWSTLRNAQVQALMAALTAVELPCRVLRAERGGLPRSRQSRCRSPLAQGEDVFRERSARSEIGADNPAVTENNRKVIAQLIAGAWARSCRRG
jgi:hypothetical protein